ncbi:hypothetical protein JYU34_001327 [Plutella xylostella]|uniref:Uncharacterized protein n=1 Tax=Plutella xylostella TaxID=51655 RepID=A0ABQ7R6J0_PLUXY|nr:hypothetical protein JYU34_001327 [Plutella xylostella]
MEEVKQSMCEMMDMFNTRMNSFHEELHKTPASTTTSGLAAEFQSFRQFITTALNSLQQQVEMLAKGLDRIDMHGRRKMLLLHGVPEQKDEATAVAAVKAITSYIKDPGFLNANDIARCNRMGRPRDKPRPILLKFKDHPTRTKVWFSKAKLKGSGFTLSEFLTKTRHDVTAPAEPRPRNPPAARWQTSQRLRQ